MFNQLYTRHTEQYSVVNLPAIYHSVLSLITGEAVFNLHAVYVYTWRGVCGPVGSLAAFLEYLHIQMFSIHHQEAATQVCETCRLSWERQSQSLLHWFKQTWSVHRCQVHLLQRFRAGQAAGIFHTLVSKIFYWEQLSEKEKHSVSCGPGWKCSERCKICLSCNMENLAGYRTFNEFKWACDQNWT